MYAEIEGPEDAPPLLLLHGGIGTGRYHWSKLVPALAERWRVHLPDLPGHGRTPLPADVDYGMGCLVGPITEYLEQLGPPVHVAGFSMGGHAALAIAQERPELFASLTLVGVSVREHAGLDDWRSGFRPKRFAERNPLWAKQLSRLHEGQGGPEAWRDVLDRDSTMLSVGAQMDGLARLECPVLLVRGDRDWAVQPEQYADLRQLWGERSEEFVVPRGGHDVQLTRARLVEPALLDFLKRAAKP